MAIRQWRWLAVLLALVLLGAVAVELVRADQGTLLCAWIATPYYDVC